MTFPQNSTKPLFNSSWNVIDMYYYTKSLVLNLRDGVEYCNCCKNGTSIGGKTYFRRANGPFYPQELVMQSKGISVVQLCFAGEWVNAN